MLFPGRPYTQNTRPTRFGGENIAGQINGNRLPWRLNVDMRLDKSFALRKNLNLNVYFRVANLLNRKNVVGVYSVSGSPADDGFLTGNEGVQVIRQLASDGRDVRAFLDAYSWMVLDPDNYTQPRRMFVGAMFEF